MVEMMTTCGRCAHYNGNRRCGNHESKHYGKPRLSNICWHCHNFDGEPYAWDTDKAHAIGERPSTFGRVDPRDPRKFI